MLFRSCRGDDAVEVAVLPARNAERRIGPEPVGVQVGDQDFIVALAALGDLGLPEIGDTLLIDFGGRLQTYRLDEAPDGARAWRYVPGNEYVRLSLSRVNDDVGESEIGGGTIAISTKSGTFTGNGIATEFDMNHRLGSQVRIVFDVSIPGETPKQSCEMTWVSINNNMARVSLDNPLPDGFVVRWKAFG